MARIPRIRPVGPLTDGQLEAEAKVAGTGLAETQNDGYSTQEEIDMWAAWLSQLRGEQQRRKTEGPEGQAQASPTRTPQQSKGGGKARRPNPADSLSQAAQGADASAPPPSPGLSTGAKTAIVVGTVGAAVIAGLVAIESLMED